MTNGLGAIRLPGGKVLSMAYVADIAVLSECESEGGDAKG